MRARMAPLALLIVVGAAATAEARTSAGEWDAIVQALVVAKNPPLAPTTLQRLGLADRRTRAGRLLDSRGDPALYLDEKLEALGSATAVARFVGARLGSERAPGEGGDAACGGVDLRDRRASRLGAR